MNHGVSNLHFQKRGGGSGHVRRVNTEKIHPHILCDAAAAVSVVRTNFLPRTLLTLRTRQLSPV